MNKSKVLSTTLILLAWTLFGNSSVFAADFEWSGQYRIEGTHLSKSELGGSTRELDYILHHLILRPKIVAGDGITINAQFDLFNSGAFPDSQLGQTMGDGVGSGSPTTVDNSNAISNTQAAGSLSVSQLYVTWIQEYGALIAGRTPVQFGLGITHNAGRGAFDHWATTRDLVGYKVVMGNLFLMPMYGKVNEGNLNQNDDVNDYMIQMQYENPETDLEMGVFYQVRKSGDQGADVPAGAGGFGGTGAVTVPVNYNVLNVYAVRDTERYRLGVEGSFMSGNVGVATAGGDKVTLGGFGVAAEYEYRPEASRWKYGVKLGNASGDDPTTDAKFEGQIFNRNYDVAMLLFNHPLGRNDVLRTGIYGGGPDAATGLINKPDVESISNALYFAPYFDFKWRDTVQLKGVLATGWLNTDPLAVGNVGKELGYEVDLSMAISPRQGITWVNEVGMLFPGSAFDFAGEKPGFAYGVISKAAISF